MTIRKIMMLTLGFLIALSSCRKEEMVLIDNTEDDVLEPNTVVSDLLLRVTQHDGSIDNILDKANCFTIKYPVDVVVDAEALTLNSTDELNNVERIFDLYDDDIDELTLSFPITIITSDFEERLVESNSELLSYAANCNGENIMDNDVECIDVDYPISASIFNTLTEFISTETFTNDKELFEFVSVMDTNTIVSLNFPITANLFDDSTVSINSITELRNTIENNISSCDEDDDYDYNDDDCNDCTIEQLTQLLTNCNRWTVENLERDSNNTEDYYVGYTFEFFADGTMNSDYAIWSYPGTWTASGTGNNIVVDINIPQLPDCNNSWRLHEIDLSNADAEFDLNLSTDKLRYISNCDAGNLNDASFISTITTGEWRVSHYFNDSDQTDAFNDYTFSFIEANRRIVINSSAGTSFGYWLTLFGDDTDLEFNLNFNDDIIPLDYLVEDWDVINITTNTIELRDVNSGDGTEDLLTLEKL